MWGSARLVVVTGVAFAALAVAPPSAPAISAKPSAADFGPTPVGATKSKSFHVKLDPGYAFSSFSGGATDAPFSTSGACTSSACALTESFHPIAIGTSDTSLTVTECRPTGGPCVFMHLRIRGVGGVFTAKPVDFGSVDVHKTKSKTLAVKLDAGYALGAVGGGGTQPPFGAASAGCVDGVCKITETFAPIVPGDFDAILLLSECPTAGGSCNTIAVAVSARGR